MGVNTINKKGYTLIELMVVIAIVGILAGATVFRMVDTSQANELGMAANLIQSILNQTREMARSPKPSGDINSEWDINGYGVAFNYDGNNKFIVFADVIDKVNPENQNKWVDPQATSNDDRVINAYDFSENQIESVEIEKYVLDGTDHNSLNPQSIVFLYSEKPQGEKAYFEGSSYDYVSIILKHKSGNRKEIKVNFKTGKIEVY
jgi:prepilin-type N-terminal cleavage/methylation domain-containing protein